MKIRIEWKNLSADIEVTNPGQPAKTSGDLWPILNSVPLAYWMRRATRIRSTEWPEVDIALCLQKLPDYAVVFTGNMPGYDAPRGTIV